MLTRSRLAFEHLERRDLLATIVGTAAGETLVGTPQGDSIFALGGDDIVQGLGGNDVLRGGDGDDQLDGGAGEDVLYGDLGADSFLFHRQNGTRDVIKDFNPGEGDRISLALFGGEVYYDVLQGPIGAEIVLANNQRIVLEGFDAAQLETHHVKFGQQGLQWLDWSSITGNKYRYAPSGIQTDDTRYIYHCGNLISGNITDYIMLRKETLVDGAWTFVSEQVVLSPGATGSWDGRHVCDPSIIRGDFSFAGTTYQYAMFYLGFDHDGGGINQIGLALANSLEGPWVKVSVDEPLIGVPPHETNAWGVGQPSVTSIDGGKVMLVYTRERPGQIPFTFRQVLDLSTADAPIVIHPEMPLTTAGLTKLDGAHDPVNHGGDVAYDPERDRFWIIRSMHPFPTDSPSYIAPALQIASIPASRVWSGGGTWEVVEELHAIEMGTDRVFDGGFLRNEWGHLNDPAKVQAIPSVALSRATTGHPVAEWTYRTHIVDIHLGIGPADFNRNGTTNGDDLAHWSDGYGLSRGARKSDGDADGDGDVDGRDFLIWQRNYEHVESSRPNQATAQLQYERIEPSPSNETTVQSQLVSQPDSNLTEGPQFSRAAWWLLRPQQAICSSNLVPTQPIKEYGSDEHNYALAPRADRRLNAIHQNVTSDRSWGDFEFEQMQTSLSEHDHFFESIGSGVQLTRNIENTLEDA